MHILKRNIPSCFSSSRVKDTYLYHQAKPPPLSSTLKKSSSFIISRHHSRYAKTLCRVMLGRGGGKREGGGPASGSAPSPQPQDVTWEEQQRQVLTHAMFTSLLDYINMQRSPAHHFTMEQLLTKLWRLPPAHRGLYTKLLMVSLIKKKVSQQRRAAEAASASATATVVPAATEGPTPRYPSPSAIDAPTGPTIPTLPTGASHVPNLCQVALPSNKASLGPKKTKHVLEVPTPMAVSRLPFSENNLPGHPLEQIPPSVRNRLSSGCDLDTGDNASSSSSMGFSSSDRSSSGDCSIFRSRRRTADHLEATASTQSVCRSPGFSDNSFQFPSPGSGQKRSLSPEPSLSQAPGSRSRMRVISPEPRSIQSTLSASGQERVFSPKTIFNLSQALREEQPRQGCQTESIPSEPISRPVNLTPPLPPPLRTPTPAEDVSFRVRIPGRQPRSAAAQLTSTKRHRRSWGNPLKRIFVQAPDTNGAAAGPTSSAADQTTPPGAPTPASENGANANSRVVPTGDSTSSNTSSDNKNSTSNVADSTSGSGGGGVSTSSNPFARVAPPSASWTAGSSSSSSSATAAADTHHQHHHRPVLAPSKLGGFGSSLSQQPFPPRPAGGVILAPSSLFGGATPKVVQPPDAQQSETKFKLKPSILGSAVTSNPFSKAPAVDLDPDSKENEAQSKKAVGTDTPSSALDKSSSAAADDSSAKSTTASSDAVDSSSEAKAAGDSSGPSEGIKRSSGSPGGSAPSPKTSSSFTTATPPPSPPPPTMRRQDVVGGNSSLSAATSSSGVARASVFGVFSQAVAAVTQENTPAASSSPKPPALSTNGVKSPLPSGSSAAAPSFIFGQNLQSRVVGSASDDGEGSEAAAAAAAPTPALDASEDNFFTAAASTLATSSASGSTHTQNGGPAKSLETSSRELAEKESREKRKFEEVQVITGEETESNVLQMNCKVYRWVKGSWQERGRGILRLNDWGSGGTELHSRLVVRTQGTLTIMLNTNIWSEMAVERASNKSVRFTASDPDGTPNIYLVMGLPKDIDLLYTSLEWRVSNARRREQKESNKRARPDDQPSSSTSLN